MTGTLRKIICLSLFLALLGWFIVSAEQQKHHESQVREMLLSVQNALQKYHVDQERYIPRQQLTGAEIIGVLSDFGFLEKLPLNPWTDEAWKLDGEEPDFLIYRTDPAFETYALQAIDPDTGSILMAIDSEENPSLE